MLGVGVFFFFVGWGVVVWGVVFLAIGVGVGGAVGVGSVKEERGRR